MKKYLIVIVALSFLISSNTKLKDDVKKIPVEEEFSVAKVQSASK